MRKIEINNRLNYKINLNLVKRTVAEFARFYKVKPKEISIAFVGGSEIKKINQAYRGEGDYFGEIIIDYNQIKRQAGEFGNSARQELIFILVHGLLHLLGYDDKTEKERKKMIKLGEEFVKKMIN